MFTGAMAFKQSTHNARPASRLLERPVEPSRISGGTSMNEGGTVSHFQRGG